MIKELKSALSKAHKSEQSFVTTTFKQLAADLDLIHEPSVKEALKCLKGGDYLHFLKIVDSWTPQLYASSGECFRWSQLRSFLLKYRFKHDYDKSAPAIQKFLDSERKCRRVNQRIRAALNRESRVTSKSVPYGTRLHRARRWIERVIGVEPNMQEIAELCNFGPGAAVAVGGPNTSHLRKLNEERWTVTPAAAPYARAFMMGDHHVWEHLLGAPFCFDSNLFREAFDRNVTYCESNNITTVEKTALTDRTIAIEPLLNGFVQKGTDLYIREKLRVFGIDLSDQTKNQWMALQGSFPDAIDPFATIDLSAASDSISIELCRLLLPPAWFSYLNAIRSPSYSLKGASPVRYEKFCSMGNGFCFPLETLIFASIVKSCYAETGHRKYSVYGDDIIVHQGAALIIIETLKFLGFSVNTNKTFVFGLFKESCGADYFSGVNVRPYYLKRRVSKSPSAYFGFLNGIRDVSPSIWRHYYNALPSNCRFVKPWSEGGDDAIIVPMDVFIGSKYAAFRRKIRAWVYTSVKEVPVDTKKQVSTPGSEMYVILRGATSNNVGLPRCTLRRKTRSRVVYGTTRAGLGD